MNLTNPKTRHTVERVILWCKYFLSPVEPKEVYAFTLNSVFSSKPTGKMLRDLLLVRHGNYVTQAVAQQTQTEAHAYSYTVNLDALNLLQHRFEHANKRKVTSDPGIFLKVINPDLLDQLDTGQFTYSLKSDRYWNYLQFMKKEVKPSFWSFYDYRYDYDIESAQGNVLYQVGVRHGIIRPRTHVGLTRYVNNHRAFRTLVLNLVGWKDDEQGRKKAKTLVTSLLNGARLSPSPFCAVYKLVEGDNIIFNRLRSHPEVRQLRLSILLLSRALRRVYPQAPHSDFLSAVYRFHERQILDCIKLYLSSLNIKYFTEHDGFRTDRPLDLSLLRQHLSANTGFNLNFDSGRLPSTP